MSLTFHIEAPAEGAQQLAFKTRAALSKFIADAEPLLQAPSVTEMSNELVKALKQDGATLFTVEFDKFAGMDPVQNGWLPYAHMLNAYGIAFNKMTQCNKDPRGLSYEFEGLVRAYHAAVHKAGIKPDVLQHALQLAFLNVGYVGAGWANLLQAKLGVGIYVGPVTHSVFAPLSESMGVYQQYYETSHSYDNPKAASLEQYFRELYSEQIPCWGGTVERGYIQGPLTAVVMYSDVDGPWAAGFVTPEDMFRMRFTRVRLGSWLSSLGVAADEVKLLVEQAKVVSSGGGEFHVYPNDVKFGSVYVGMAEEVGSCMAARASEYRTWDGIHPVDVYSAAWFGSEDNHLALFTFNPGSGPIGRGIVNTKTMQCVRWYGAVGGERALKRLGIGVDCDALCGSWLAKVSKGSKIIAPYLDGNYSYVKLRGNKLVIGEAGTYACETNGVIGAEEVYCCDTEEYEDKDTCTFQPESNTWISEDCADWRCPIIDEWCPEGSRSCIYLDGEEVEVHDRVTDRPRTYLRSIPPSEDMLDSYAERDDETGEIVDTSGVPENFTRSVLWGGAPMPATTAPTTQPFNWDEAVSAMAAAPVLAAAFEQPLVCNCPLCRYGQL